MSVTWYVSCSMFHVQLTSPGRPKLHDMLSGTLDSPMLGCTMLVYRLMIYLLCLLTYLETGEHCRLWLPTFMYTYLNILTFLSFLKWKYDMLNVFRPKWSEWSEHKSREHIGTVQLRWQTESTKNTEEQGQRFSTEKHWGVIVSPA